MKKHLLDSDRCRSVLDFLAIVAPIICLIDCIVLPAVAVLLPFVSVGQMMHGISDQMIAAIVLAICMTAIVPGFLKHRSKRVLVLFSLGVSLLFFTSFIGHYVDQMVHTCLTIMVSFFLIKANLENKKLLSCACSHHHHHHEPVEERVLITTIR